MTYTLDNQALREEPTIAVVGCGGTGAFVAEGLCRLLGDRPAKLALIDHDRVEPHNLRRQAFYAGDVGEFKAQVVAQRLSRRFGREIAYSVYPYDESVHRDLFDFRWGARGLVIGCVDNPSARRAIAELIDVGIWYIDAGNAESSGQVFIGNVADPEALAGGFYSDSNICTRLPLPTVQSPELLAPLPEDSRPRLDCAEAVGAGDQSPTINGQMATLTLEFVSRLLLGTLSWMAAFVDLGVGSLTPMEANPKAVARMTGVDQKTLVTKTGAAVSRPCDRCGVRHV